MALKNSKTGSLPVSEIYNFMTEHFPYFKVSSAFTGGARKISHSLSLSVSFPGFRGNNGGDSRWKKT